MRRSLIILILAAAAVASFPAAVSAKGVPLKGRLLETSKPVQQTTGNCACNWQWYTFGLNPGKMTVTATMQRYGHALTRSWGIRLFVYRGPTLVGWKQAACWSTQRSCMRSISIRSNVSSRGIYYARVEGPGADGIIFTIRLQGRIYNPKCGSTCQSG